MSCNNASSLRCSLSAIDKVNEIKLALRNSANQNVFYVLVEGVDDIKIYPKFFKDHVSVEYVAGGKGQLLIALNSLSVDYSNIIGIQDADFRNLSSTAPSLTNKFFTDFHDIEMLMLNSVPVIRNLLCEYKLLSIESSVLTNILSEVAFVGYVKWYNELYNREFKFKGVSYGDIVSVTTDKRIRLIKDDYISTINTRSSNKKEELTQANIDVFIEDKNPTDLLNLCNGHDCVCFLGLILGVKPKFLTSLLRITFTLECFKTSLLYQNIDNWQKENDFDILAS